MKKIILFLLITLPSLVFSQEMQLSIPQLKDSLKKYQYKLPDTYIKYASILEKKLTAKQQTKELILLKNYLTRKYYSIGQYEKALNKIDEALLLSKTVHNDSLLAVSYKNKGNIFLYQEKYIPAIRNYVKCDSLANSKLLKLYIKGNYAFIHENVGNYEAAIAIIKSTNKEVEKDSTFQEYRNENMNWIFSEYIQLYIWYHKKNHRDSARKYLTKLKKLKDYNKNNIILHNKILLQCEDNNNFNAIPTLDSIINIYLKNNKVLELKPIYYGKARCYVLKKKYSKALIALKKIDSLDDKLNTSILHRQEVELLYAKIYKGLGKYQLGLKKQELANKILKKQERVKAEVLLELKKHYSFNNNRMIKKLQVQANKSTKYLKYVLVISFFLLIFIVLYFRNKKKRMEKEFRRIIDELKNSNLKTQENITKNNSNHKNEIPTHIVETMLIKLKQFEKEKIYLKTEVSLNYLAKHLKSNRTYTSIFIKQYLGLSFKEYINQLRINYTIERLQTDKQFRAFTIEAIADEVGYKTAETFSKAFKKQTKMLPSSYIMELKKS